MERAVCFIHITKVEGVSKGPADEFTHDTACGSLTLDAKDAFIAVTQVFQHLLHFHGLPVVRLTVELI